MTKQKGRRPQATTDYILDLLREKYPQSMTKGRLFAMTRSRTDRKAALRQLIECGLVKEERDSRANVTGPKSSVITLVSP